MSHSAASNFDPAVSIREMPSAEYPSTLAEAEVLSSVIQGICSDLGWSDGDRGSLGAVIEPGDKVLLKPNFVLDHNQGPWGMAPMITHRTVIHSVVKTALRAQPGSVLVADAPIQNCDFDHLLQVTGLDQWSAEMRRQESRFLGVQDLRRTIATNLNGRRVVSENVLPEERFVLYDLGSESLLEPITTPEEAFRVTCYDPRLMARTHAPGRHRYLVAKDVIEADVVINLPKLKTHKKAGVTCALKNLIGINGNKEYLPHHRIGGANIGGDCYPGESRFKRFVEFALDQQNLAGSDLGTRVWTGLATQLNRALNIVGDGFGIEGSWAGNDTIWRTGLDLNRILLYGKLDGSLADTPQRRVIHLVDAIVAGQAEGPLAPQPLNLGLLIGGNNAAAVDWIGASLLGYSPEQVSIVREAFRHFRWPITTFSPQDIVFRGVWTAETLLKAQSSNARMVKHPIGWQSAKAVDAGDLRSL